MRWTWMMRTRICEAFSVLVLLLSRLVRFFFSVVLRITVSFVALEHVMYSVHLYRS